MSNIICFHSPQSPILDFIIRQHEAHAKPTSGKLETSWGKLHTFKIYVLPDSVSGWSSTAAICYTIVCGIFHSIPWVLAAVLTEIYSRDWNIVTHALKGFDHTKSSWVTFPMMLMHLFAVSMIAPCLVVIGLSQKVHRWPPNTSVFKLWQDWYLAAAQATKPRHYWRGECLYIHSFPQFVIREHACTRIFCHR